MHPKDDLLRAFVDHEINETQTSLVETHLHRCPDCAARLAAIQARAVRVNTHLDQLAPAGQEMSRSPQSAFKQFRQFRKESSPSMFKKRSFWVTISVVAVLAIALSITPVRAWASNLLSLFRVQQVTVVSFDPQAISDTHNNLANSEETIRQIFKDDLEITDQGEVRKLDATEDPAQAVGFTPRLPQMDQSPSLFIKPGMQAKFTINQPVLQALLDTAGIDVSIPTDIDGSIMTLDVPTSLIAVYGDCSAGDFPDNMPSSDCPTLIQVPSPSVNAPEGLDLPKMGEGVLQFLGYSPAEAHILSTRIDWATTLILPIPQGEGISYQDVTADGVPATFLSHNDGEEYLLVWVKKGILYALQGQGSLADAQAVIATLQ